MTFLNWRQHQTTEKKEVEQETKELLNSEDELQQKAKRAEEKTKEHTEQGFSRTQNLS